jgi:hypothetical protein
MRDPYGECPRRTCDGMAYVIEQTEELPRQLAVLGGVGIKETEG